MVRIQLFSFLRNQFLKLSWNSSRLRRLARHLKSNTPIVGSVTSPKPLPEIKTFNLKSTSRTAVTLSKRFSDSTKAYGFAVLTFDTGPRTLTQSRFVLPARTPQGRFLSKPRFDKENYFRAQRSALITVHGVKIFRKMYALGVLPQNTTDNLLRVRKTFTILTVRDASDLLQGYINFCLAKEQRVARRAARNRINPLKFSLPFKKMLSLGVANRASSSFKLVEGYIPTANLTKDYVASSLQSRYANFTRSLPTPILELYFALSTRLRSNWSFLSHTANVLGNDVASKWPTFVGSYASFFMLPRLEFYLQKHKAQPKPVRHLIRLRFNQHRLVVSLVDRPTNATHFFISTGLFTKYFEGRKSLRKNKTMKTLMVRFLRKLLVILGIREIILHSRGVPLYLDNLLTTLFRPLAHPFPNPFSGETVDEVLDGRTNLNISSIIFQNPKPFGYQPTKKRGRIKRKIRRKLTRLGGLVD